MNLINYGFSVTSFAYPFGHYDEEAKQTVIDCGYANARGVSGGPETIPPADKYALRAMPYIVSDTRVAKMMRYITSVEQWWQLGNFCIPRVCDGCSQYSIDLDSFSKFADLIAGQKQNGLASRPLMK